MNIENYGALTFYDNRSKMLNSEQGAVYVFVCFLLLIALQIVGLVTDFGISWNEERQLQIAVDAGALAGVNRYVTNPVTVNSLSAANLTVVPEAIEVAGANRTTSSEIVSAGGVVPGNYNPSTQVFSPLTTPLNALEVNSRKQVDTIFGRLLDWSSLVPEVSSLARIGASNRVSCLVPFGLDDDILVGRNFGDILDIGRNSPGNWGKLDIGGNMSSLPNFVDAMINGICGVVVNIGDQFDPATGFAGVRNGFDGRIASNPIVTLPVVDRFPNGNSQQITIMGFVVVELISQGRRNGANWNGTIRFLNRSTGLGVTGSIPGPPFASSRVLVR